MYSAFFGVKVDRAVLVTTDTKSSSQNGRDLKIDWGSLISYCLEESKMQFSFGACFLQH